MKLFLHIGTEKTGSSYLQSIAAINRELLRQHGIWFPHAGNREQDMLSGNISPGNAQPLADALSGNAREKASFLMQRWVKEAEAHGCDRLLLSNETLMLVLGNLDAWKTLINCATLACIDGISYLLLFRDPVELALSLYKHRAKRGTTPDIEEWIVDHFEYGQGVQHFFENVDQMQPNLACKKYAAAEGYLERVFFIDWLDITDALRLPKKEVNTSLNLSELLIIKNLKKGHSLLPHVLYDRFMSLPRNEKATEPRLESYYRAIIARELAQYATAWERCQMALPQEEPLILPDASAKVDTIEKAVTLSPSQVEIISNLMKDSLGFAFRLRLWVMSLRRNVGQWRKHLTILFYGKK